MSKSPQRSANFVVTSQALDHSPLATPSMNGAESLLQTLAASGVEICFGNPGTSEMHFVAALDRVPGMRAVLGLFEGVVTGAADGYARMADKPATTLLHLGPGMANGLANLHNARKAQVPIINIIGDHATYHRRFDVPLTSDVKAFASTVSHWVHSSDSAQRISADAARAVQAARTAPGQIASLILPADTAWQAADRPADPLPVIAPAAVSELAIAQSADALRAGRNVAILLRGAALRGAGLQAAGRIAAKTGARLVSDTFAPRIERGAGRVTVERLPYRPADVFALLEGVQTLILVGSQPPVAFFAYPDQPSELMPSGCRSLILAHPHEDGPAALETLANTIGARHAPFLSEHRPPELPQDRALDAETIMRIVGHQLPDGAIVTDEILGAGVAHYLLLETAAAHDYLNLTGGAIGNMVPVAIGAAIACPDRKVISLQSDGSAMFTLQALWTQAREKLDITTIIFANRTYGVLNQELQRVGAHGSGPKAISMLDLHDPSLDWVRLAEGMGVEAVRTDTARGLSEALKSSIAGSGPRLIEALL
jgi:acetolactate synthase I/II/III large subunit